jgi:hypothetical protein
VDLSGPDTRIVGGDITIFGGDEAILNLSNLSPGAISASGKIEIAVGNNGIVNLQGNNSPVLVAQDELIVAADVISLETGLELSDMADAPNIISAASQILYRFSLLGPDPMTATVGSTLDIPLTLFNNGSVPDSYQLSWTEAAGWPSEGLPPLLLVAGYNATDLVLKLSPPSLINHPFRDVITVTAVSQADPSQVAKVQIEVKVENAVTEDEVNTYLPLIIKK